MKPEIQAKWPAALRSGHYKQGIGALLGDDQTYCCLGVLTALYIEETKPMPEVIKYFYDDVILNWDVKKWAGLKSLNPVLNYKGAKRTASSANDEDKLDFDEIADAIDNTFNKETTSMTTYPINKTAFRDFLKKYHPDTTVTFTPVAKFLASKGRTLRGTKVVSLKDNKTWAAPQWAIDFQKKVSSHPSNRITASRALSFLE